VINPVLVRELSGTLQRRRVWLLQCALAVLFSLLIWLRWPTDALVAESGGRAQEVLRLFSYGLLATMLLLLPVFPATSLVREKIRGTLALLLNTPMGPWRIYFGKFLGVMALAGLVLLLSLPAAAACYAMGGVSLTGDLLPVYAILALTAVQTTAVAFLVSSYAGSTDAAVRWTYGVVLILTIVTLVPHYFFVGAGGLRGIAVEWLRCLSPLSALMAQLGASEFGSQGVVTTINIPGRFAMLSLGMALIAAAWTISRLNHTIFDRSRAAGMVSDELGTWARLLRRLMFLVDPHRRSRPIGRFTNPLMVKEFRCRKFGRLHWLLRLVAACIVLSLAMTILTTTRTIEWDVQAIGAIMVVLQVALLVVITPSLAAGIISAERESGGWALLQMTPISVWRIAWGKLLSVILTLALILCATLPGYVVMVYIDPGQSQQIQRVVICLVATAMFTMLLCAAIGSLFSQTAPATATAYAVILFICIGPLLVWWFRDAPFGHGLVETALTINPIAAALSVIRVEGFRDYQLIPAQWWVQGITSLVSLAVLVLQIHRLSRPQ
jgi:ABC-type transport system involved in multi-copper enzyme maturation permease subunit